MLEVTSIEKGIVIDHIKEGRGLEIFHLLGLDKIDCPVALIMNAESEKMGRKDLIKISGLIDFDLDILGIIDGEMTVNIINDEKVVEKYNIKVPEKIEGYIKCKNPRCITSTEDIKSKFVLVDREARKYKCVYCETIYGG